jgi:hypothetical protein
MTSKEELISLGFEISHSTASQVKSWGAWFVGLKHPNGRQIAGYGSDEEAAFADALKTATTIVVQNTSTNRHG